jgi:hypothetical protein
MKLKTIFGYSAGVWLLLWESFWNYQQWLPLGIEKANYRLFGILFLLLFFFAILELSKPENYDK